MEKYDVNYIRTFESRQKVVAIRLMNFDTCIQIKRLQFRKKYTDVKAGCKLYTCILIHGRNRGH